MDREEKIAVIGLGYVGLPLAIEFSKKYEVIGFDISQERINNLRNGIDLTLETTSEELNNSKNLLFTSERSDLSDSNIYIVTVPTPIDDLKKPDLEPLKKASEMIGSILCNGDIVIYESTVFPGATEEFCVPILEKNSNLKFNTDFFVGYSPERINPGDKKHRLPDIRKVTSGSNKITAKKIDDLYGSIITAGTYLAESIKVAEAAKVIENTQRDINIALMNELSIIFNKLDINTYQVLEAAGTKWNFLKFSPGFVGGHCIGVDPYYLTYRSKKAGYSPKIILAGRNLNDEMASIISEEVIFELQKNKINPTKSKILILGFSFKENCPDIRNTKIIDLFKCLEKSGANVDIHDPWCDSKNVENEYNIQLNAEPKINNYDAVILAVPHNTFKDMGVEKIKAFGKKNSIFCDLKNVFPNAERNLTL